jgi:hypothetical protein
MTCAVYAEGRCIGHVVSRGRDGIEAFDRDDQSIGLYPTNDEAARALWRHDRSQWVPLAEAADRAVQNLAPVEKPASTEETGS